MKSERRTHISLAASALAEQARADGLEFLAYLLEIAAREAGWPADNVVNLNTSPAFADAAYLREQASRCVRLARQCQNLPISHDLEVIGVELMAKAAELDGYLASQARAEG